MVRQKNSTCRACCWKNKRPTWMLSITSPKKFHLLWRLTFPMSINVFNSNFPKKWKIFVRTVHQNFRMARQTISVSTRSIRFVPINPITTGIATLALKMKSRIVAGLLLLKHGKTLTWSITWPKTAYTEQVTNLHPLDLRAVSNDTTVTTVTICMESDLHEISL